MADDKDEKQGEGLSRRDAIVNAVKGAVGIRLAAALPSVAPAAVVTAPALIPTGATKAVGEAVSGKIVESEPLKFTRAQQFGYRTLKAVAKAKKAGMDKGKIVCDYDAIFTGLDKKDCSQLPQLLGPQIREFYANHIAGYRKLYRVLNRYYNGMQGKGPEAFNEIIERISALEEIDKGAADFSAGKNAKLLGGEFPEIYERQKAAVAKEFEKLQTLLGCKTREEVTGLIRSHSSVRMKREGWQGSWNQDPHTLESFFYNRIYGDVINWLDVEGEGIPEKRFWLEVIAQMTDMISLDITGHAADPNVLYDERTRYEHYVESLGYPNFFEPAHNVKQISAFEERKGMPLSTLVRSHLVSHDEQKNPVMQTRVPVIPNLDITEHDTYFIKLAKQYGITLKRGAEEHDREVRPATRVQIDKVVADIQQATEDKARSIADDFSHAAHGVVHTAGVAARIIGAAQAAANGDKPIRSSRADRRSAPEVAALPAPETGNELPADITGIASAQERLPVNRGEQQWADRPLRSEDEQGTGTPG